MLKQHRVGIHPVGSIIVILKGVFIQHLEFRFGARMKIFTCRRLAEDPQRHALILGLRHETQTGGGSGESCGQRERTLPVQRETRQHGPGSKGCSTQSHG
jgi:hypothetical protein